MPQTKPQPTSWLFSIFLRCFLFCSYFQTDFYFEKNWCDYCCCCFVARAIVAIDTTKSVCSFERLLFICIHKLVRSQYDMNMWSCLLCLFSTNSGMNRIEKMSKKKIKGDKTMLVAIIEWFLKNKREQCERDAKKKINCGIV